jgi:hypothetical protein
MGRLIGSELTLTHHQDDHKCGKCGMTKAQKSNCCHNEVTVLKVNDSHQLSAYQFEPPVMVALVEEFPQYKTQLLNYNPKPAFVIPSPPGKEYSSLLHKCCIYRI